jgi:hypothetical protein
MEDLSTLEGRLIRPKISLRHLQPHRARPSASRSQRALRYAALGIDAMLRESWNRGCQTQFDSNESSCDFRSYYRFWLLVCSLDGNPVRLESGPEPPSEAVRNSIRNRDSAVEAILGRFTRIAIRSDIP